MCKNQEQGGKTHSCLSHPLAPGRVLRDQLHLQLLHHLAFAAPLGPLGGGSNNSWNHSSSSIGGRGNAGSFFLGVFFVHGDGHVSQERGLRVRGEGVGVGEGGAWGCQPDGGGGCGSSSSGGGGGVGDGGDEVREHSGRRPEALGRHACGELAVPAVVLRRHLLVAEVVHMDPVGVAEVDGGPGVEVGGHEVVPRVLHALPAHLHHPGDAHLQLLQHLGLQPLVALEVLGHVLHATGVAGVEGALRGGNCGK